MTRNNRIREIQTRFGAVTVDRIISGNSFVAGTSSVALLSQEVMKIYPGSQAGNSRQDGLYDDSQFDNSNTTREFPQVRYCLVKVPSGQTVEQVQARVNSLRSPSIYRILSNNVADVLTDEQMTMLTRGQLNYFERDAQGNVIQDANGKAVVHQATMQSLEDRYAVKGYKRNEDNTVATGTDGKAILIEFADPWKKRQFRAFYFSATAEADMDLREGVIANQPAALADEHTVDISTQESPELATERITS